MNFPKGYRCKLCKTEVTVENLGFVERQGVLYCSKCTKKFL